MDWVFCNKCSIKFQQSMKYYLGDCGHIVCERCVSSNTGNQQCLICKEPASTLELSKLMNPSMQMLFWPFENVIEQCYKVFKFQNMHRNLYVEALMTKYNFLKKEYLKNYAKTKMLRKENHFMKEKLQSLGYHPIPSSNSSSFNSTGGNAFMNVTEQTPMNSIYGSTRKLASDNTRQTIPRYVEDSFKRPSPAQMVPKHLPVPIHSTPITTTPNYMDRFRSRLHFSSTNHPNVKK